MGDRNSNALYCNELSVFALREGAVGSCTGMSAIKQSSKTLFMVTMSSCSVSSARNSTVLVPPECVRTTPKRSNGVLVDKKYEYAFFAICAVAESTRSSKVETELAMSATLRLPCKVASAVLASNNINFSLSKIPIGAGCNGMEFFGCGKGVVMLTGFFRHVSSMENKKSLI